MGYRGMSHGLLRLDTHVINGMDFNSDANLRTAPPMAFTHDFDIEGLLFGQQGSTINPNALHYNESPHSMSIDPTSPFGPMTDIFDWLTGFEHQMSFNNVSENAVDGSSPSAVSNASQWGISDVMLDGSGANNPVVTAGTSSMWQPGIMGPPQMPNPYSMDLSGAGFLD
ncbi:uncharacterized protein B0I36DRAFT_398538, partial [Microdochium trichocladiopsis]